MIKILSVVGARPNFMKVAPIDRAAAARADVEHIIVHTGQHYDASMSDAFFRDLDMPQPASFLGVGSGSHGEQTARVIVGFEQALAEHQPDYVIVVGDVNSTIACALVAVKAGIRTGHVESGLRSGDRTMPEEINRLATDAIVDDLFVTEQSGLDNLAREGHDPASIHFVGNTMIDSLHYALPLARQRKKAHELGLVDGAYALVTLHRPSNVDDVDQLRLLIDVLADVSTRIPMVFPVHPRTRSVLERAGLAAGMPPSIRLIDPAGYVDFLSLMQSAAVVITDSGGIQEETTALGVPCITARTTTERPVTVTHGTNLLVDPVPETLRQSIHAVLDGVIVFPRQVPPLW
ncbi:MAG: UDP-N-acetylglucosamine 2-epimerase (non-hydrolyzing), partial [Candidatus Kapabacteria bacterium]|nr:UDP-N-acetylglucosamine 2-epimerase (non-hydrolyzing) [Candidatus Kapabacteria bacterium]